MATINELKEVLKEHLEDKGVLNQLRTSLRSEIFKTLNDQNQEAPRPSNENYIINELVKEYLEFNNYHYTSSVFESESGNDKEGLERQFIANQLKIVEDSNTKQLPLLYSLVYGLKKQVKEEDGKVFKGLNKGQSEEQPRREDYKSIFEVNNSSNTNNRK